MQAQKNYIHDDILLPDNDMMEFMPGAQLPNENSELRLDQIEHQFNALFRR